MDKSELIEISDGSKISFKWVGNTSLDPIILTSASIFNFKHYEVIILPSLRKLLENKFSFLLYDYVGIANSSPLIGDFDFIKIADQHLGLMDALNIEKAHLFGYSEGSVICQIVTSLQPERVLSLAGYGNPNLALENDDTTKTEFSKRYENIVSIQGIWDQKINSKNFNILFDTVFLPSIFPGKALNKLSILEKIKNSWIKKKLRPMLIGTKIENIAKLFRYYTSDITDKERQRYREAIQEIKVPTLWMHGTSDELVPINNSVLLNQWVQSSKLVKFDNYDHTSPNLIKKRGENIMKEYSKFLNEITLIS